MMTDRPSKVVEKMSLHLKGPHKKRLYINYQNNVEVDGIFEIITFIKPIHFLTFNF